MSFISKKWYSAGLPAGWSGVQVPAEDGNLCLHYCVQTGSDTHTASYPMGYQGALFLEVKRPDREADHSPPSSTEIKNVSSYTSTHPILRQDVVLRQHRDKFNFTF